MKSVTSLHIITVAFILSLSGFIISMVMPQNNVADVFMVTALFVAGASGIIASIFTRKLAKSRQWIYLVIGLALLLLSFPVHFLDLVFLNDIIKVSGGAIAIAALGYYIYLHKFDFRNSEWIWFMPVILLGCIFRYMYWTGGNIIIFSGLTGIVVLTIIQLIKLKKYTRVRILLLVWQMAMCGCIIIFYFRYITWDYFIIGYIFTWLALMDILLQHEINMLENNEYR